MINLIFIKNNGIAKFLEQQKMRTKMLETMIKNFDDGRSKSFYCKEATRLDLTQLRSSLDQAAQIIEKENVQQDDLKKRAKILRKISLSAPTPPLLSSKTFNQA